MLTPEDAEKVLTKNLANVIRKAHDGRTLTAAEVALLEQHRAGAPAASPNAPPQASAYAKNWDDLAHRLGVSRRTLHNVRKRHPETFPRPRADGRHDVAAWSRFFVAHNIARAAEDQPVHPAPGSDSGAPGPETVADWKAEKLRLECIRLEIENAKTAGELVEATDVEAGLSVTVAAFRQALNNLPGRLAQKALGCQEFHELEAIAQEEVNVILRVLQRADFLAEAQARPPIQPMAAPAPAVEIPPAQPAAPAQPAKRRRAPGRGLKPAPAP